MERTRPIFLIVGRTASGKDTLTREACNKLNMRQLISWTTRPMRFPNEDTHHFGTIEDFEVDKHFDNIVASTEINGHTYWATETDLFVSDFYIIDPNGLSELKKRYPYLPFVTIYIDVPFQSRRQRFLLRQPYQDDLFEQRNNSEDKQFTEFENNRCYDYRIENNNFDVAIQTLIDIVQNENKQ